MAAAPMAHASPSPTTEPAAPLVAEPSNAKVPDAPKARSPFADYVAISKPRILVLLLVVAWAAMAVAAGGWPGWLPFVAVTLGGTFSTAASGAYNHLLERKQDAQMGRTSARPVATGRISPKAAFTYATVMAVLSMAVLWVPGYRLAALLNGFAILYYVLVYTVLLKPSTPQNIVIGGLAGSFPALIGWAAVMGNLALPAAAPAFLLALLVFLWTPAHFWALALFHKEEYAAAGFPMLPNVKGEAATRRQIVVYSVLTVLCSLAIVLTGGGGWVYLAAAVVLGLLLTRGAIGLTKDTAPARARKFFFFTIQYLGVLLLVLVADRFVPMGDIPGI